MIMKEIPGYEGKYSATDDGRIYSHISNRFLAPYLGGYGYLILTLMKEPGKGKTEKVHKLIARTFLENPDPKFYTDIDHIDMDKTNNAVSNLRWLDHATNVKRSAG